MIDPLRQELAATCDALVVKVGTRVLTAEDGALDEKQIASISSQLAQIAESGRRVVLVSSGAVGAGIGRIGLRQRPTDLAQLQAAAAVGQSRLIEAYNREFERHGRFAAQVLLTADDFNDRARYLNIRNTLLALFEFGAIPIINENDTVRVDELQRSVGDNDRLAAMVTNLIRAPLLVLLSDVEGLYDGDPKDAASKVLPTVEKIDDRVRALVRKPGGGELALSVGGMASKIEAARIATTAGENVIVASGRRPNALVELLEGKTVGTLFLSRGGSLAARKRWIGMTARPLGRLLLDSGARRAIENQGKSLLAVGITAVDGRFSKGDPVALCDEHGVEFARGLTNYNSGDVGKILRQPSERFSLLLGHCPYQEVVHRDNLTLVR